MANGDDGVRFVALPDPVSATQLSADGSRLFVAAGSHVYIVDARTGQTLHDLSLGQNVAAMDLSESGRYLGVTAISPGFPQTEAKLFRIDTQTAQVTPFAKPISGDIAGPFQDIVMLSDGRALVSQAGAGGQLLELEFSTATMTATGVSADNATLIASPDHKRVLVVEGDIYETTKIYETGKGMVATYVGNPSGYDGASVPMPQAPRGAFSPSGDTIFFGSSMKPFDRDLKPLAAIPELSEYYYTPGAVFSPDGEKLYLVHLGTVLTLETDSWEAVAGYALPSDLDQTAQSQYFGDALTMSADGKVLAAITAGGVDIVSLAAAKSPGTPGDDVLPDGSVIFGFAGNDTLGAYGKGAQAMVGGPDDDTYYLDDPGDSIRELAGEGRDRVFTKLGMFFGQEVEEITYIGVGSAVLSGGLVDNVMTGGPGPDALFGGGGVDRLIGGAGNDQLEGGADADVLEGGGGDDLYIDVRADDRVVEAVGAGVDEVRTLLTKYTLDDNVEILVGTSAEGQALTGNDLNNVIKGGTGADTLRGKRGDDIYYVDQFDTVVELRDEGRDTVHVLSGPFVLPDNVEDMVLQYSANSGTGNALDNVITSESYLVTLKGMAGNDTLVAGEGSDVLDGGAGEDTMKGGLGADTYYVDNARDRIEEPLENDDGAHDTVVASIDYELGLRLENLTLAGAAVTGRGNDAANVLLGNDADNVLYGLGGDDQIDGGKGADRMVGGEGADRYLVDNAGDRVEEAAGQGVDQVSASVSHTLAANVENLTLTGDAAIDGTGNAQHNVIWGNGAANHLRGLGGDDTFYSGGGDDVLDGGDGQDVAVFGGSRSLYEVSGADASKLSVTSEYGDVELVNIERLRFADGYYVWDAASSDLKMLNPLDLAFRQFVDDGFVGGVGGRGVIGTVIGTIGFQDITVDQVGYVQFDTSFNRGGDVIRFTGDARDWVAQVSGSQVSLSDGIAVAAIPVGVASTYLVFDDGVRALRVDAAANAVKIGAQTVDRFPNFISAPAEQAPPFNPGDADATSRLFLSSGGVGHADGNVTVIGTTGAEKVYVVGGDVRLDSSFNRGGDRVNLRGDVDDFTGRRSGSSVILEMDGTSVTIPVGEAGATLDFRDESRRLYFDADKAQVMLGDQVIGFETAALAMVA